MEIRPAADSEIPAIIELLKISLGENLTPKSEKYWRWKHLENPFGPSSVLLCWEGHVLVGVRAFMRWEWTGNGKSFRAVRAVDTATHPQFQGKGIFKKLTLSLVESCKQNGDEFVFNTPNAKSKPGYIKMGWRENGKLPITIGFNRPFNMASQILLKNRKLNEISLQGDLRTLLDGGDLEHLLINRNPNGDLVTKLSLPYLKWRYCDVPVAKYGSISMEEKGKLQALLICRVKDSRIGRELRITDCIASNHLQEKELKSRVREKLVEWNIDFCTISSLASPMLRKLVGDLRWKAAGPTVTTRPLALSDLGFLNQFRHWRPSIGDLELF